MKETLTRIVFCGAPASGKTSILNMLKERIHPALKKDWNITFLEESATYTMLTNRLTPKVDPIAFQRAVVLHQLLCEDYQICVDPTKPHNLSLIDRGVTDAFVYIPDQAESLLDQTLEQTLRRYDHVIYFQRYLTSNVKAGNACRYESEEELRALEERTFDVWSKHPSFTVIPVFKTISDKVDWVCRCLNRILGEKVFVECLI